MMQIHLQIQWIEKENQVFALVVSQFDILELSSNNGSSFEVRSRLLDKSRQESAVVGSGKLHATGAVQQITRCQRHNTLQITGKQVTYSYS